MLELAKVFQAMGLGFGVASAIVIFQAYRTRDHLFLKYFGISFVLYLLHVVMIELPRLVTIFTGEAVIARYTSALSIIPVLALYFFIRAMNHLVSSDLLDRHKRTLHWAFGLLFAAKLLIVLLVDSFRTAELISWISYNLFVVIQAALCLFAIRASGHFQIAKKRAIHLFCLYYLVNILATIALNYLSRLRLIEFELFLIIYYAFAFIIDAAPLIFISWFSKHYLGNGRENNNTATDSFVQQYGISQREREIIDLLCQGKTNREIGEELFISHQTVKDHVYKIFRKTSVKNRISLANMVRSGT